MLDTEVVGGQASIWDCAKLVAPAAIAGYFVCDTGAPLFLLSI